MQIIEILRSRATLVLEIKAISSIIPKNVFLMN